MGDAVSKTKLLEWLDVEIDLSSGQNAVLKADRWAFQHVKREIKRGKFDVPADREQVTKLRESLKRRIADQRSWGNPVNLEIARELSAILDEMP